MHRYKLLYLRPMWLMESSDGFKADEECYEQTHEFHDQFQIYVNTLSLPYKLYLLKFYDIDKFNGCQCPTQPSLPNGINNSYFIPLYYPHNWVVTQTDNFWSGLNSHALNTEIELSATHWTLGLEIESSHAIRTIWVSAHEYSVVPFHTALCKEEIGIQILNSAATEYSLASVSVIHFSELSVDFAEIFGQWGTFFEDNPIFTINARPQAKIKQQKLILLPQISTKFIHLNNNKENLNGKRRMGKVLEEVGKGEVYADPKTIDQDDSQTSMSIDFIIAQSSYNGQHAVAMIYSFEVACTKDIAQIQGKAMIAQKRITNFLNEYEQSTEENKMDNQNIELPIHSWQQHILCADFSTEELDYQPTKEPSDNGEPKSSIPLQVLLTASSQIKVKSNNKQYESIHQSLQLRVQNIVKNQEMKKKMQ